MAAPPPDSLYQQLLDICRFLERRKIPYMVVGGIAVGVWTAPRATVDLDFVIGVTETTAASFMRSAADAGLVVFDPKPIELQRIKLLRAHAKGPKAQLLTLDFILAEDHYQQASLERAISVPLKEQAIRIATPEDVILLKLLGGRGQDLVDAENIVRMRRETLDRDYLRRGAGQLSLADSLNRLFGRS